VPVPPVPIEAIAIYAPYAAWTITPVVKVTG